jgi:NAD(P)H-nitrite reductase large subunit
VKKLRYVIIGNSTAAIGAAEAIRKNDKMGAITIISDEGHHTYSRPLISYYLLGKTTEGKMKYRSNDFYTKNNCELLLSKKVIKINADENTVELDDGQKIEYDKLLVATGSSPFVPPMEGLENVKNKFKFYSLDDAIALDAAINENSKVLIIGAGLIGLKCAEGISKKVGCTCVDLAPKVLSSILDDASAKIVKEHLEENGISFYLGDSVKKFEKNKAILASGKIIEFDILVLAVGVRPNTSLVNEIGGKVDRGITVNDKMETSVPNIYAAGDCTECIDVSTGEMKVLALLPNAYMQGECAGMNMSGTEYIFNKALPMNAIGFFGLHMLTAGTYKGETYYEGSGKEYKKLFYSDNKLNGYILIGKVEKAGIYTSLVREKTPLDSIDFDLICKTPGLMAFSKEARFQKLGGDSR